MSSAPSGPVDGGVVQLGEDGEAVLAQPLDDVDLPQRMGPIQGPADQAGDQLDQLVVRARRGERRLAQVELQVEVRVLDPERMVELQGHLDQPPAQRFQVRQAPGQLVPKHLVGRPVRDRPGRAKIARPLTWPNDRAGLHVQEAGVHPAQLLHDRVLPSADSETRRSGRAYNKSGAGRPVHHTAPYRRCRRPAGSTGRPPPGRSRPDRPSTPAGSPPSWRIRSVACSPGADQVEGDARSGTGRPRRSWPTPTARSGPGWTAPGSGWAA